mmetsp:Transcript_18276/g.28092  ORF Transcript_18276/g.28092 Transcript_18276/m.28092 type:complete len:101 (-) Transcript_18276:68-370(-)
MPAIRLHSQVKNLPLGQTSDMSPMLDAGDTKRDSVNTGGQPARRSTILSDSPFNKRMLGVVEPPKGERKKALNLNKKKQMNKDFKNFFKTGKTQSISSEN